MFKKLGVTNPVFYIPLASVAIALANFIWGQWISSHALRAAEKKDFLDHIDRLEKEATDKDRVIRDLRNEVDFWQQKFRKASNGSSTR